MAMAAVQQENHVPWWHVLFPQVAETPQGLFRPFNRFIDYGLPAIGAVLILGMFLKSSLAGLTNYFILGYLAFVIAPVALAWRAQHKFGTMGRPLVRIDGMGLYMGMALNVRPDHIQLPLANIRTLVVKGTPGQLSYVFERHAGDPIEVRPGFGRTDPRVVAFLQRALPPNIPVEVREPPTFLGAIRGD